MDKQNIEWELKQWIGFLGWARMNKIELLGNYEWKIKELEKQLSETEG